jgi:hypothetical protein
MIMTNTSQYNVVKKILTNGLKQLDDFIFSYKMIDYTYVCFVTNVNTMKFTHLNVHSYFIMNLYLIFNLI